MATVPLPKKSPLLRLDTEGRLRSRRYLVSVSGGPDTGKSAEVQGVLLVGSDPSHRLCLTDPTVSRNHLELEARPEGVRLRDLGSTNGTFLRGTRILEALLDHDEVLDIGSSKLRVRVEEEALERPPGAKSLGQIVSQNAAMHELFGMLERVAPTDSTVVLLGETGTGKELFAEAIHQCSHKRDRPFVVVDCAAVAPTLFESELFGHVKGAFTGASADRRGAFLEADGGTVFLDELGELPLEVQPKLLRVLESGSVKRVGEDQTRRTDVRIIAATNRDLETEVEAGRFRKDLYFRLAVVVLRVPPLRERLEDLPWLVRHFVSQVHRGEFELPPSLLESLSKYDWPGNLRELRNVVERAVSGGDAEPLSSRKASAGKAVVRKPFKEAKEDLVNDFSREYFGALLTQCRGNVSEMARVSGINRNHVVALLVKLGLRAKG